MEQYYTVTGLPIPPPPRRLPSRVSSLQNKEIPRSRYDVVLHQLLESPTEIRQRNHDFLSKMMDKAPPHPLNDAPSSSSIKADTLSLESFSTSTENSPRLHFSRNATLTPSVRPKSQQNDPSVSSYCSELPTLAYVTAPRDPGRTDVSPQKKEVPIASELRNNKTEEERSAYSATQFQDKTYQKTPARDPLYFPNGPGGSRNREKEEVNSFLLASPKAGKGFLTPLSYTKWSHQNNWTSSPMQHSRNKSCLMGDSPSPAPPVSKRRSIEEKKIADPRCSTALKGGGRKEGLLFPSNSRRVSTYPKSVWNIPASQEDHYARTYSTHAGQNSIRERLPFRESIQGTAISSEQRSVLEEDWCSRLQALLSKPEVHEQKLRQSEGSTPGVHPVSNQLRLEGMEILPHKPTLQCMHNSYTSRYVHTLQQFKNSQPAQIQDELDKVFQQYAGKEDILCKVLSLLFVEEFREFSFTTPSKSRHSTPDRPSLEALASPVSHHQQRPPPSSIQR